MNVALTRPEYFYLEWQAWAGSGLVSLTLLDSFLRQLLPFLLELPVNYYQKGKYSQYDSSSWFIWNKTLSSLSDGRRASQLSQWRWRKWSMGGNIKWHWAMDLVQIPNRKRCFGYITVTQSHGKVTASVYDRFLWSVIDVAVLRRKKPVFRKHQPRSFFIVRNCQHKTQGTYKVAPATQAWHYSATEWLISSPVLNSYFTAINEVQRWFKVDLKLIQSWSLRERRFLLLVLTAKNPTSITVRIGDCWFHQQNSEFNNNCNWGESNSTKLLLLKI